LEKKQGGREVYKSKRGKNVQVFHEPGAKNHQPGKKKKHVTPEGQKRFRCVSERPRVALTGHGGWVVDEKSHWPCEELAQRLEKTFLLLEGQVMVAGTREGSIHEVIKVFFQGRNSNPLKTPKRSARHGVGQRRDP